MSGIMMQLLGSGAGGAGDPVNVENVFHTQVYTGTNANQQVTNGIDLSTEGGLIWFKSRSNSDSHRLINTEAGLTKALSTNNAAQETNYNASYPWLTSFNTDGYTIGNQNDTNYNGYEYLAWTFRKAPRFFDCVKFDGNGTNTNAISHNLGSTPGLIIIKNRTTNGYAWPVWHRSLGSKYLELNNSNSAANGVLVDQVGSSTFNVLNNGSVNGNGDSYIAYVFAHNDGDGTFGPDGDQDIIKCGEYTGDGTNARVIDLGFEPQFLLIREKTGAANWYIFDMMRGFPGGPITDTDSFLEGERIIPASSQEEQGYAAVGLAAEGFYPKREEYNVNNTEYIYMAIRRPTAVPEASSEVFAIDTRYSQSSLPSWQSGFVVDLAISKSINGSDTYVYDRGRSPAGAHREMAMNSQSTETSASQRGFDHMNGWGEITSANSAEYSWMWRRAPKFFDTVQYLGNGTAGRTVKHSLGVVPEMIWIRNRLRQRDWVMYHTGINGGTDPEDYYLRLNATDSASDDTVFNDTAPTATQFTVNGSFESNSNGEQMIAWLFATLPGVSKVGSYIGNSTNDRVIDCGFSNGTKFVWIKEANNNSYWFYFDSSRGITTGTDKVIDFSRSDAQVDETNYGSAGLIKPDNSGFKISNLGSLNNTDGQFVFYAVAA